MRVGVMRAGYVGGGVPHVLSGSGRDIAASLSGRPGSLQRFAADIDPSASDAGAAEALESSAVVVVSAPGRAVGLALSHARARGGKPAIDTTSGSALTSRRAEAVTLITDSGFTPGDLGAAADVAVTRSFGVPAPLMARIGANSTRTRWSTRYATGRPSPTPVFPAQTSAANCRG